MYITLCIEIWTNGEKFRTVWNILFKMYPWRTHQFTESVLVLLAVDVHTLHQLHRFATLQDKKHDEMNKTNHVHKHFEEQTRFIDMNVAQPLSGA